MADYAKFDDIASREIGWYVYALRDPRDGVVFYVGKGRANRWFDHIQEARVRVDSPHLKLAKIREIEAAGESVDAFIVRRGLTSEKVAYEVEAAVIHALRLLGKSPRFTAAELTNIAEVHYPERGLADVRVVQSMLNAPRAPEIDVPCGLFRIPRLWFPEMSDEDFVRRPWAGGLPSAS